MAHHLEQIEFNLLKRLDYDLQSQSNFPSSWEEYSRFTTQTYDWNKLIEIIKLSIEAYNLPKKSFFYYCIDHWYNHWHRLAVEEIFKGLKELAPTTDHEGRLVDFSISGLDFKVKSVCFPNAYPDTLYYAQHHTGEFIHWLERHREDQLPQHCLYLVSCSENCDESWKVQAQISNIAATVHDYFRSFSPQNLISTTPKGNRLKGYADVIWVKASQ